MSIRAIITKQKAPTVKVKPTLIKLCKRLHINVTTYDSFYKSFSPIVNHTLKGFCQYIEMVQPLKKEIFNVFMAEIWQKRDELIKSKNAIRFISKVMAHKMLETFKTSGCKSVLDELDHKLELERMYDKKSPA